MSFCLCSLRPFPFTIPQIRSLEASIYGILDEEEKTNDCLVVAVLNLLTSAARYQVLFLLYCSLLGMLYRITK